MKKTIAILACVLAWMSVQADLLTDITDGKFKSAGLSEMSPLADGERYAQLVGNDIFAYGYKSGAVTDTLFDYARAKGVKPGKIEGFVLPPGTSEAAIGRYLLVYANSQKIFRRSFCADYYVYDRQRREMRALSDTMPVLQPVFSPDGKYVAFVRENNLYIHKLDFKTEVAVTRDGKIGSIVNGVPNWL